jgi:glucans biosynthesis protein C
VQTMTHKPHTDSDVISVRRHELDWLRVVAVLFVLFYHTGMIFNTWEWHIKNNETSTFFSYWMPFLHYFRMPLLLFISGAGTYMALGKRTPRQYITERFKRLVIPLVLGMLIVVPPMVYLEHIQEFNSYWDVYKSFFDFIPFHKGSISWYHLWFIGHLFVYSFVAIPLLIFLRSAGSKILKDKGFHFLLRPVGILLVPATFILMTQLLLRPNFVRDFNGSAFFAFYLCFFLFGIICYSSSNILMSIEKNRKYLLASSLLIFVLRFACHLLENNKTIDTYVVECATEITSIFVSWFWVVTIIAYGQHYLNRSNVWLGKITESAYPFYILHQPFLFVVAYYICQLPWSISAKFWSLSLLTLVVCIVFYLLFIRPFNAVRFLFGMKPKRLA